MEQADVERVARAMQAVSRPDVDPDKLTPGPRGSVGLMAIWQLYERMATAALAAINQGEAEILRERAQIVAWLRSTAPLSDYAANFADAIERGDHAAGGEG